MRQAISSTPEVLLDCRNRLGESVVWDDRTGTLHWTNIHDREIWSWTPRDGGPPQILPMPGRVGALGLREAGGLVVAFEKGFALVEGSAVEVLARVDPDLPTVRLNDGRVDPAGRFVCGGMDEASPQRPLASLYALRPDRGVDTVLDGIHCTNSLCWDADGRTMFVTDMPTGRIDAFDYDLASGRASDRRPFAALPEGAGLADGSVIDAEGCLWNAQWQGGRIVRYRPDGRVDRDIPLPISNPTCLAFAGANLDVLVITSAWFTLTDAQRSAEPHAGSLFALRPGVRGRREHRYAG